MSVAFALRGPAGRLEALLDPGENVTNPTAGAVVCHPHPLRGGTMHNTNVYKTAKALARAGFDVLRFNFRGVALSAGAHDDGRGEREDVGAAFDALHARGCAPLVGVGYSFGAAQILAAGIADARVAAIAAMGLPVNMLDLQFAKAIDKPLLVVQGEQDVFGSPADVRAFFRRGSNDNPNIKIITIDGAGHFFEGRAEDVANAIADFAKQFITKQ
ncbi:MAG: dienelactone hydrolase family protein [Planctomycetes bacterium]|nr:dienelactone hydrolase family protein [Planctomycetota bacterium]